jgi:hypothetical protein
LIKAPVKVIWTREDDMSGGSYRPAVRYRFSAALDNKGNLVGYKLRGVGINAGNCTREDNFPSGAVDHLLIESVEHKSINKWGIPSTSETRKFNYLVSIEEARPGFFNVEEYRGSANSNNGFPDGLETNGLPAMVLIFHPYNAGDFEMTCEGLARWNGSLAWQVHFRQRSDRPNRMRAYRLGASGPSFAVALKGRAWIAADNFQIVRLETDMIAPLPQIRLAADYTVIEYGLVHFSGRKLDMWLPKSAEVYFDWRGRRIHRRHSFSKYLLFSVDDKQSISAPKATQETPPKAPNDQTRPNR